MAVTWFRPVIGNAQEKFFGVLAVFITALRLLAPARTSMGLQQGPGLWVSIPIWCLGGSGVQGG